MIEHQIGELEPIGCEHVGDWWGSTLNTVQALGSQVITARREKQAIRAGLTPKTALAAGGGAFDWRMAAGVGAAVVVAWLVLRK